MSRLREPLNIDLLRRLDADKPVTMLNLMKFRAVSLDGDGSGWDAYLRYSAHTIKLIKERGGTIIWAGKALGVAFGPETEGDWDYVALVQYPTPGAFLDMMESAQYQVGNVHRENGTERHLIFVLCEEYSKISAKP